MDIKLKINNITILTNGKNVSSNDITNIPTDQYITSAEFAKEGFKHRLDDLFFEKTNYIDYHPFFIRLIFIQNYKPK